MQKNARREEVGMKAFLSLFCTHALRTQVMQNSIFVVLVTLTLAPRFLSESITPHMPRIYAPAPAQLLHCAPRLHITRISSTAYQHNIGNVYRIGVAA